MADFVTFTTFQLIIDGVVPSVNVMQQLVVNAVGDCTKEGVQYKIVHRIDSSGLYYWLYAEYGKPLPLADELFDVEEKTSSKNPRKPSQAELRTQLFVLYDFSSSLLYISNASKTGFLQEFMCTSLNKGVCIKKIYKTAEEFLEIIKLVDSIRLIAYSDLFTTKTGLFDESTNLFGLGEPNQLKLELKFFNAEKTISFNDLFLIWRDKLTRCEIGSMVCVGYDDKNMEIIFNTDSFANKIEVKAQKNNNGMYLKHFVENSLIHKIGLANV